MFSKRKERRFLRTGDAFLLAGLCRIDQVFGFKGPYWPSLFWGPYGRDCQISWILRRGYDGFAWCVWIARRESHKVLSC